MDDDFWLPPDAPTGLWDPPAPGPGYLGVARAAPGPDAPLPDDTPPAEGDVPWAPGALAGVLSHHTTPSDEPDARLVDLVRTIRRAADGSLDRATLLATYESLQGLHTVTPRMVALAAEAFEAPADPRSYTVAAATTAAWLACRGAHRGPVKAGLAVAALIEWPPLVARAATLGRLTEVSREAVTVLSSQPRPDEAGLHELARWHHGWGRVHAVEALCRIESRSAEVDDWLMETGWTNSVMDGYTAPLVATYVDVASRIVVLGPDGLPDRGRLDAARGLLLALLDEFSPGDHLADVPAGPAIVEQWLFGVSLTPPGGLRSDDLVIASLLLQAVQDDFGGITESFTPVVADRLAGQCWQLLDQDAARPVIEAALSDPHAPDLVRTARLAPRYGIDPTPALRARVQNDREDTVAWYTLTSDPRYGDDAELVEFALALLGPDFTSSRAAMPIGPGRTVNMGVHYLWQGPGRDPALGRRIVRAMLDSPAVDARGRAALWLGQLPEEVLAADAREIYERARREPDPGVRSSLVEVLTRVAPEAAAAIGPPATPEATLATAQDVQCWTGSSPGRALLGGLTGRPGSLTLTNRALSFAARDEQHSRTVPLASLTACRADRRGGLVVEFRDEAGAPRTMTFGRRLGMPDVEAWVATIASTRRTEEV